MSATALVLLMLALKFVGLVFCDNFRQFGALVRQRSSFSSTGAWFGIMGLRAERDSETVGLDFASYRETGYHRPGR
jgi:hypothetical protein